MTLEIHWRQREVPLAPSAVVGVGRASFALARRLLAMSDEALGALRGVSARELIGVLGPSEKLPWVDGVVYLGKDPRAPSLLIPTALEPTIAPELVERALTAGAPKLPPLLVLPVERRVTAAGLAQPVQRGHLTAFVSAGAAP